MKEEEDKITKLKLEQIEMTTAYEHFATGDNIEYGGISEQEIEEKCEELFKTAPIVFQPREESTVDKELAKMMKTMNITIPILWVKGNLYLVGVNRIHMDYKGEHIIAHVGGGYEKFEMYISKNHKVFERQLIIKMLQC